MAMVGAFGDSKEPTDQVHQLTAQFKPHAEEKLGQTFTSFVATGFKTQVVAGTNYLIDVKADDKTVQLKVYEPLPHTNQPPQLSEANLV